MRFWVKMGIVIAAVAAAGVTWLIIGSGGSLSDRFEQISSSAKAGIAEASNNASDGKWQLDESTDRMSDEPIISASTTVPGDPYNTQVSITCTAGKKLSYKFAFAGNDKGEGSVSTDLKTFGSSAYETATMKIRLDKAEAFTFEPTADPRYRDTLEVKIDNAPANRDELLGGGPNSFLNTLTKVMAQRNSVATLMAQAERIRITTKLSDSDVFTDFSQNDPIVQQVLSSCSVDRTAFTKRREEIASKNNEILDHTKKTMLYLKQASERWSTSGPVIDYFHYGDCTIKSATSTIYEGTCAGGSADSRQVLIEERSGGMFVDLKLTDTTDATGIYASEALGQAYPIKNVELSGQCWVNLDLRICFTPKV